MTQQPAIFIINLPRDAHRRDTMKARLDATGLDFDFFEAVDGYALKPEEQDFYDRAKRLRYFGRDLLPGELGCLLSHRKFMKKWMPKIFPMRWCWKMTSSLNPNSPGC